ncbi:MAG TPA: hypothetical protein VHB48_11180, partial [Chitinophagaceae bacterium]|nr:hypothetical protein [Chitinophagaceae bacterium]
MRNVFLTIILMGTVSAFAQKKDYPIQPVSFTQVHVTDNFWRPKMEINADVTIPYILRMLKEHGRINNFLAAAGK